MKVGRLEFTKSGISWKGKDINNLLNRTFYRFIGTGNIIWFDNKREAYVSKGYSDNEIIFSIMRLLLSKYTQAPFILSKVTSEKHLRKFKSFQAMGGQGMERGETLRLGTKALEEIQDHELLTLLQNPNKYQGQAEFLEAAFGFYKLLGETFIYKIAPENGPNKGKAMELHVLPAHLVEVVYSGDWNDPVRGYKFCLGDMTVEIPAEHVMHLKTWNPNWDLQGTQLRGFSPMQSGGKVLTRNNYNKTAQTKAFVNGGAAYLLTSSNADMPMTVEQVDQVNDRIREKVQGPDNYHNITATSALVNAVKIGESPADLKLIEADKNDLERLCMIFGVDSDLFLSGSTFNNKKDALKSLVTNVVLADLIRFRDSLSKFLLTPYKDEKLFLDFDTTVYTELQPDLELMKKIYGDMWAITPNELRAIFQYDSSEQDGMDDIWIPMGISKMNDVGIPDDEFEEASKNSKEYQ